MDWAMYKCMVDIDEMFWFEIVLLSMDRDTLLPSIDTYIYITSWDLYSVVVCSTVDIAIYVYRSTSTYQWG
jgi:hypothetical protein